jgi:hypothetical protein
MRLLGLRPAARFAALAEIARSVNERPMLVVIAASHLMSALAQIVISRRTGVSMRSAVQLPARFNESQPASVRASANFKTIVPRANRFCFHPDGSAACGYVRDNLVNTAQQRSRNHLQKRAP